MSIAEVFLWGSRIGVVSDEKPGAAMFEYDPDFLASGVETSPIMLPLRKGSFQFPNLSRTFHGLPGMLADSLPDKFGNAVIDRWLQAQGRLPGEINAVERLCYTGTRGMGALEYKPAYGQHPTAPTSIDVDALVGLASDVLQKRESLHTSFENKGAAISDILIVGSSAGGARAKAVIAWSEDTNVVLSGQVEAPPGFSYWLMKFDGVANNADKEAADPQGFGAVEFAYSEMAKDAGVEMTDCRLFEENGRRHFMTKRFDREENGRKLHMQSLAGIAHLDFNAPGAHSYEEAFTVMRRLKLGMDDVEQLFRRMVFNVIARNQDDHVKNTAFLMDRNGKWSLSPAYDVMWAYNPSGQWTSSHQMSLNGKRDSFIDNDFVAVEKHASMKSGRALSILEEVRASVSRWLSFADAARIPEKMAHNIGSTHRHKLQR